MEIGDRVFVLIGLEVEEWEVYQIREDGHYKGPWIQRDGRMGCAASYYTGRIHATLDEAVAASKAARERSIKSLARQLANLGINTSVKVRLMRKPAKQPVT